jgi:hypothetical protein
LLPPEKFLSSLFASFLFSRNDLCCGRLRKKKKKTGGTIQAFIFLEWSTLQPLLGSKQEDGQSGQPGFYSFINLES